VRFRVEKQDESSGRCDCCGTTTRCVWGLVYDRGTAKAAYWVHWTVGKLDQHDAIMDLAWGDWGDETTPDDRFAISVAYRQMEDSTISLMVIDSADRPFAREGTVARRPLARADIIGSPFTAELFALTDAIALQDGRFF